MEKEKKAEKKIIRFAEKIKYSWKTRFVAFQRLRSCFFFSFSFCLLPSASVTNNNGNVPEYMQKDKRFKSHL